MPRLSLQYGCCESQYQDVFPLLLPSCCDKSETSCYHLVTRLMTVTDLLDVAPTRLLQTVRTCCYELVVINLLTTCYMQTIVGTTCCESADLLKRGNKQTNIVDKLEDFCRCKNRWLFSNCFRERLFWRDKKPGFIIVFKIYISCLILRINIKYINVIAINLDNFSSVLGSFEGQFYEMLP